MAILVNVNPSFRHHIACELKDNSDKIADEWLQRLDLILDEKLLDIFPSDLMLDHIPSLIEEVAKVIAEPENELAVSSSLITRKAEELGKLRHQQDATVHQLLQEYDILARILEEFLIGKTEVYPAEVSHKDCIQMMSGAAHVVRMILQTTVDTFVEKYMETIKNQTEKIASFNDLVSHELRKPLQSALLASELLLEENYSGQNAKPEELQEIKESILQAAQLLKNIEDISTPEVNQETSPVIDEIQVQTVINNITVKLKDMLVVNDTTIRCENDLGVITTNVSKFALILTNIITNGIKYCDPEKLTRSILIRQLPSADSDYYAIEISDNGLGIEKSDLNDIFKLNKRCHENHPHAQNIPGRGLGLYLARQAVNYLGGTIEVDSHINKGTTFTITIPRSVKR